MGSEMKQFQDDLLESVKQMRQSNTAENTTTHPPAHSSDTRSSKPAPQNAAC